jgi:hypothetical protein
LNRIEFYRLYGSNLTREVSDSLFDLIDKNKDGAIDIDEWVVAKNILGAGRLELKLKCGLSMCQDLQGLSDLTISQSSLISMTPMVMVTLPRMNCFMLPPLSTTFAMVQGVKARLYRCEPFSDLCHV